ncbi:hypothetical protein F2Q68_00026768 [Brassica cretica]|uniref:Uncharacterized protein n=2 Tax=Brassica cretica TaxID=69181 RepID=A0A8S9I775_BRACR|nr:hypothetical protein F2Q68_00026768 [Brassica cretica]
MMEMAEKASGGGGGEGEKTETRELGRHNNGGGRRRRIEEEENDGIYTATRSIRERKATKSTTSCDGARDLKKPWCGDGRRSYRGWWRWNPARRRR